VSGSHNSRHPTFRRAIIKAQRAVRAAAHRRATVGAVRLVATFAVAPMLEGLAVTIVGRPVAAKGGIFGVAPELVARDGIFAGAHPVVAIPVADLADSPATTAAVQVAIRAQLRLLVSQKVTVPWRKPGPPR